MTDQEKAEVVRFVRGLHRGIDVGDGMSFHRQKLNAEGLDREQVIEEAFAEMLAALRAVCPPGRDLALVTTKLEEACFYAVRAMASHPDNQSSLGADLGPSPAEVTRGPAGPAGVAVWSMTELDPPFASSSTVPPAGERVCITRGMQAGREGVAYDKTDAEWKIQLDGDDAGQWFARDWFEVVRARP